MSGRKRIKKSLDLPGFNFGYTISQTSIRKRAFINISRMWERNR
jgi:hypothetical protein